MFRVLVEQRVQVRKERFRIPDVCVVRKGETEQILNRPPLLCVEILSKEDTVKSTHQRIADYLAMGVPAVCLIDPQSHRGYIFGPGMRMEEATGVMRAPPILGSRR